MQEFSIYDPNRSGKSKRKVICGYEPPDVGIEGLEPAELAERLMNEHRIYTAAINRPGVRGVRVTPNVYTTKGELNALVSAIKTLSA